MAVSWEWRELERRSRGAWHGRRSAHKKISVVLVPHRAGHDSVGAAHINRRLSRMSKSILKSKLAANDRCLVTAALKATKNAYAPYSHFRVGAAVMLKGGGIVSASNFENASYGVTICAETSAMAAVSSNGRLREPRKIG